jgi:hypothetical protein
MDADAYMNALETDAERWTGTLWVPTESVLGALEIDTWGFYCDRCLSAVEAVYDACGDPCPYCIEGRLCG